jgi:hypothetical protein
VINPLTPNDPYRGRAAPLTSKRCILYIYSTNIGTEFFKHGINSPFFSLQNAVCFIILMYLVPVLFTFYIQGVLKLKKNNSGTKRLIQGSVMGLYVTGIVQTKKGVELFIEKFQGKGRLNRSSCKWENGNERNLRQTICRFWIWIAVTHVTARYWNIVNTVKNLSVP